MVLAKAVSSCVYTVENMVITDYWRFMCHAHMKFVIQTCYVVECNSYVVGHESPCTKSLKYMKHLKHENKVLKHDVVEIVN